MRPGLADKIGRRHAAGWTAEAIAEALQLDPADVLGVIAAASPVVPLAIGHRVLSDDGIRRVREMSAAGLSRRGIAKVLGVSRAVIDRLMAGRVYVTAYSPDPSRNVLPPTPPAPRPSRKRPTTRIHSQNGPVVRRMHFVDGQTAEAIAEALQLDPARVADFLARLTPRQAHHRRREQALNRPRSAREQGALSEWMPNRADDPHDLVMLPELPAAAVPELLDVERPVIDRDEVPAQICATMLDEDWGSWHANVSPSKSRRNASLADADAVRIRQRRAEGASRKDLAREYDVSVATITKITRGETYRDAAAVELDLVAELPATSPVEGPEFERWEEPPDDRMRWVNAALSYEDAVRMRGMSAEGVSRKDLEAIFGVSKAAVQRILSGACYAAPPLPCPGAGTDRGPE